MLVPNSNYCKFEDWIMPILDKMLEEQEGQGVNWTPSKVDKGEGIALGQALGGEAQRPCRSTKMPVITTRSCE
jgi:deoxyhypusine synthase